MGKKNQHTMLLPRPVDEIEAKRPIAMHSTYREVFYPLGFPVQIEADREDVLCAARESWSEQAPIQSLDSPDVPLIVRIGVTGSVVDDCPPAPVFRANGHLLAIVAGPDNFASCDLERGFAFAWVSEAALGHRSYFRYHFLEAIVMCLLTGSRVTPIHAACVSLNGHGMLLCGESGAGKSTLAYACARAGFTLTSDDASYVVWSKTPHAGRVRANCHQVRFRPSAREFFPEIAGRDLTPRAEGKPSIEIRTAELSGIAVAPETPIHSIVLLKRHAEDAPVQLNPLPLDAVRPYLENSLYLLDGIHDRQAASLRPLLRAPMYEFRYRDLPAAIERLKQLAASSTYPPLTKE
jgi:hypothetical protein